VTAPTVPAAVLPHFTALQVLLDAQLPAAVGVHVGGAPGSAVPPYVVLYPREIIWEGSLGDRYRDLLLEFQASIVGTGPEQVLDVAGKVPVVLLTQLPTITGRTVQPLWKEPSGEALRRDDDVNPPLFFLPLVFQMRTEPSP
jgi:hypothetical protein